MKKRNIISYAALAGAALATPSFAQAKTGDPVIIAEGLTLDPIFDARLAYEHVDQPLSSADSLTMRTRAGLELASDIGLSFLVESEATLGIINDYNDTNIGNGVEPYSVVADPENIELNRIQLQFAKKDKGSLTVGRQRINIDDQRFVGSVGWRQNEQTFDAVSGSLTALKPLTLEATYAISQRTIFGADAGVREDFDGDFIFLGAGAKLGPLNLKSFAYLLDFDAGQPVSLSSSATYGLRATAKLPVAEGFALDLAGSYAVQKDYKANPADYSVDYIAGSVGTSYSGFSLKLGYERLGSDGAGNRFQTPLATLHKFNGWADVFLSTPPAGLEDKYVSVAKKFNLLGGVTASAAYHDFSSDAGSIDYGTEFDAALNFKINVVSVGLKYANYNADGFAVDTEKFWLRLGYRF
ncbi:alginate export family protein [Sphingorhabdus sp. SMR4y]|uniref:alginate export family protein n=1 Tax=Sphingorhabdus sp. SMR4y TaxID=2584094 RepID=UPI000B5CA41E|nr:alginate export family protein [Sphingorhabdus sp. SMR4y]ASK89281.1 alginate export [Sphingorhabdus sp. SMR4y]